MLRPDRSLPRRHSSKDCVASQKSVCEGGYPYRCQIAFTRSKEMARFPHWSPHHDDFSGIDITPLIAKALEKVLYNSHVKDIVESRVSLTQFT